MVAVFLVFSNGLKNNYSIIGPNYIEKIPQKVGLGRHFIIRGGIKL